jgi:CheY-like chemotaxis protein
MSRLPCRILLADDSPDVIQAVSDQFRQLRQTSNLDIDLLTARSGTEVLEYLRQTRFDILMLDYHLGGGMNAGDILDQVCDPFGSTLVILFSGRDENELRDFVYRRYEGSSGTFKFVRKPVDSVVLQSCIGEIQQYLQSKPLPVPLAYPIKMFEGGSTSQGRITAAKDIVEAIVKLSAFVLLSDLYRHDPVATKRIMRRLRGNLTLGTWINLLSKSLSSTDCISFAPFAPEIPELLRSNHGGASTLIDDIIEFKNAVRDPIMGHGFTHGEDTYSIMVERYGPKIRNMCSKIAILASYSAFSVERTRMNPANESLIDYDVWDLMGAMLRPRTLGLTTAWRMVDRRAYLWRWDGNVLELHPFVLYRACSDCRTDRVFTLDNIQSGSAEFNSFCNHRIHDMNAEQDLKARFPWFF